MTSSSSSKISAKKRGRNSPDKIAVKRGTEGNAGFLHSAQQIDFSFTPYGKFQSKPKASCPIKNSKLSV
jgi:hypothetical protein